MLEDKDEDPMPVNPGLINERVSQVESANANRGAGTMLTAMLDDLAVEPPVLTPGEAAPKGPLLMWDNGGMPQPEHWERILISLSPTHM